MNFDSTRFPRPGGASREHFPPRSAGLCVIVLAGFLALAVGLWGALLWGAAFVGISFIWMRQRKASRALRS